MKRARFRLLLLFLLVALVAELAAWQNIKEQERELLSRAWRTSTIADIERLEAEVAANPKVAAARKKEIEQLRSDLKSVE